MSGPSPSRPSLSDDRRPFHVQSNGARVGKYGERLEVRHRDGTKQRVPLGEISHLSVFGQVQVTPAAVREAGARGVGISYFSSGGRYYGATGPLASVNVLGRVEQFRVAGDAQRRLPLARSFVWGKLLNRRTLLRRNAGHEVDRALARLTLLARDAARADSREVLLGIEEQADLLYFEQLARLLGPSGFKLAHGKRTSRDPVSALLSFAYSLLCKDARAALISVGLDPTVGFFHDARPGRPALALDLMGEFEPLIADSIVLTTLNKGMVRRRDFVRARGAVALSDTGRRAFLSVYERRMEREVMHPRFGYRVSYRRVLELQARLLARTLLGEAAVYPTFHTR